VGSVPGEVIGFLPNSFDRTSGSTQPPIVMSTINLPRGKGRQTSEAENLTATSEPIV
jgi:hypothetical protein